MAIHLFLSKLHKLSRFQRFLENKHFIYERQSLFKFRKKGINAISRKKFHLTEKVHFLMIFCLFHCFHQTINKKHWILPQYTFFLKKIINDVFLNVFRSINGILNKTIFTSIIYAIWIKKEILPKKWLFQVFFRIFICFWRKPKKYILYLDNIFFL